MQKLIPIFLFTLAVVGCQAKLQDVSRMTIEPGEKKSKIIDAIGKDQTIKITAAPAAGQFNVFVFLQRDETEVERDIEMGKKPAKVIAQKIRNTTPAELSALIPANQKAVVMLTSGDGRKTVVDLKITN